MYVILTSGLIRRRRHRAKPDHGGFGYRRVARARAIVESPANSLYERRNGLRPALARSPLCRDPSPRAGARDASRKNSLTTGDVDSDDIAQQIGRDSRAMLWAVVSVCDNGFRSAFELATTPAHTSPCRRIAGLIGTARSMRRVLWPHAFHESPSSAWRIDMKWPRGRTVLDPRARSAHACGIPHDSDVHAIDGRCRNSERLGESDSCFAQRFDCGVDTEY
jgi:hypothetical protein